MVTNHYNNDGNIIISKEPRASALGIQGYFFMKKDETSEIKKYNPLKKLFTTHLLSVKRGKTIIATNQSILK